MCKFLSAIGFKNGDIICDPNIDSHEDLIRSNDLKESHLRNWVRIEYSPDYTKDYHLIEKYKLHIDDNITDWIMNDLKEKWVRKLKAKLKRIIVTESRYLLSGNVYILSDGIVIDKTINCRIVSMINSKIGEMKGSSNVGVMWESSSIGEMKGSSNVGVMRESSSIGEMKGSSSIGEMNESSSIGEMKESSNVGEMWESSSIGEMKGSSNVGVMRGSSSIGEMKGSSNVSEMKESSNVGVMWESSKIKNDNR